MLGRPALESPDAPQSAAPLSSQSLGPRKGLRVLHVGRVRQQHRPPVMHHPPVDHPAAGPEVRELAAVPVAPLDVRLELYFSADGNHPAERRGRLRAKWPLVQLRRIDPNETHAPDPVADDAIPVSDADDLARHRLPPGFRRARFAVDGRAIPVHIGFGRRLGGLSARRGAKCESSEECRESYGHERGR